MKGIIQSFKKSRLIYHDDLSEYLLRVFPMIFSPEFE